MSAIFGTVDLNNKTGSISHLEKMGATMAHRGPDGIRIHQDRYIGLGHCMLHTTPQSLHEQLPYSDPETQLIISTDLRIDNREDLCRSLGIPYSSRQLDSSLVLKAYTKWGTECFSRLIGDFSIAIWDSHLKQLICARDFIGVKPFYYSITGGQFLFSSEIKALATHPNVSLTVNEGIIAEYLSCSFCSRTETLFQDISRLAAGHYLTYSTKGIQIHQYWKCVPKSPIHYNKSEEYTEHFLEIFKKSVESRLRSHNSVSFELSGGLDSSCVVGMATSIFKDGNLPPPNTYAIVFPGLRCDERSYIDAAAVHNHISPRYVEALSHLSRKSFSPDNSFMPCHVPNLDITTPLYRAVLAEKSRVVLSGVGGDQCFNGSNFPYLELVKDFQINLLIKELRYKLKDRKFKALRNFLLTIGWPFLPPLLKMQLTRFSVAHNIPLWFTEKFRQESQIFDRIHHADPRNSTSNLKEISHTLAFGPTEQWALEMIDAHRGSLQVESRHPFLDQRVVDFVLSIPAIEIRHLGVIKRVLRNTNNSLLPQKIRNRTGKAEFSYLLNRILKKTILSQSPANLQLCKSNRIYANILQDAISLKNERVRSDQHHCGNDTWNLWFAYSVNMWYDDLRFG